MPINKYKSSARDIFIITVGVILTVIASKNIYDTAGLVTGGVSGAAIIIKKLTGVPLWITNTVINVPLFIGGILILGKRFIGRTIYAVALTSAAFAVLPDIVFIPQEDLFLNAVFGGVLMGVGSGLVFISSSTTGGTDLLAAILQKKIFRQYSLPKVTQVLDAIIVLCGVGTFGIVNSLYAVVSIFVFTKISDEIVEGMHYAKGAYIISDRAEEIANRIMRELERGVTGIKSVGLYTKSEKVMLYCVLSKREIVTLKDMVQTIDPFAFVIVSDVREVLGEGFSRKEAEH